MVYFWAFAWWLFDDQPTGAASAMYAWIRLFYGSVAIGFVGLIGLTVTCISGRNLRKRDGT